MPDKSAADAFHRLKNHLSIILGFADLVLQGVTDDSSVHADVLEIRTAAVAALAEVEGLAKTDQSASGSATVGSE